MNSPRPVMLYDGDCGFCVHYIQKWKGITGGAVEYLPYQENAARFSGVSEAACRDAVQLVFADGTVLSGAHAVLRALDLAGRWRILHRAYHVLPLFGGAAEFAYQWVAHHRFWLSKVFIGLPKKCA